MGSVVNDNGGAAAPNQSNLPIAELLDADCCVQFSLKKLAHLEGKEVLGLKDFEKALQQSKSEYGCGIAGKATRRTLLGRKPMTAQIRKSWIRSPCSCTAPAPHTFHKRPGCCFSLSCTPFSSLHDVGVDGVVGIGLSANNAKARNRGVRPCAETRRTCAGK